MFVDEARVKIMAGRGGDGMVAFRREKYVPRGGPSGGDGGKGGDVIFRATRDATTLAVFRHRRHVKADSGRPGGPKNMTGRGGADELIEVPVGTLVFDVETDHQLADLTTHGQTFVVAKGGDGGQGNQHFATSRNRAPRRATPGHPGEEREVRLELKLLADVGLVGFPSVGKSTLITAVSNARPKVAAYPFTTLVPNLGVVSFRPGLEFVIADIPGLIEGAHRGEGLGIQFLKHIERCNVLVHVLEVTQQLEGVEDGRDPLGDYHALVEELERFDPELLERPQIAVLNKIDLPRTQEREADVRAFFEKREIPFFSISAASHLGLEAFVETLGEMVLSKQDDEGGTTHLLEWWEREDALPSKSDQEE